MGRGEGQVAIDEGASTWRSAFMTRKSLFLSSKGLWHASADPQVLKMRLVTSRLATVGGVALATNLVANRPDTLAPKQGDVPQPLLLVHAQALEYWYEMVRDMTTLIQANRSTCPIYESQVISKTAGERLKLSFPGKGKQ